MTDQANAKESASAGITMRDYQQEAVQAPIDYWARAPAGASPLVVMPTGSGKSVVLGETCRILVQEYGCRVVVATHRKELVTQDARAIKAVWPAAQVGVWSAGLGKTQWAAPIVVCGVQTAGRRAKNLGWRDVLIIDEAHLVSPDSSTQYGKMIGTLRNENADLRLIGYTATPFRVGQGLLTQGDDSLFDSVCCNVVVARLIKDGWLSNVVTGYATAKIDLTDVGLRGGEFALADLALASDVDSINGAVIDDVGKALAGGRKSAMIFGVSVDHAKRLRGLAQMAGYSSACVTGETDPRERERILLDFKARKVQVLTSCDVLTTGFDAPVVDVIALVRATMSPGLYVQMVGRGMRLADGKTDCLLLDYGGNIARHGPIDDVRIPRPKGKGDPLFKACPECHAKVPVAARSCPHCDHDFPAPEEKVRKANPEPSKLPALRGQISGNADGTKVKVAVGAIEYARHIKRDNPGAPPTLRIDYWEDEGDGALSVSKKICSEWVCIEHDPENFAGRKARQWWAENVGCRFPDSVDAALDLLRGGYMARVVAIDLDRSDPKWPRVTRLYQDYHTPHGDDDEGAEEGDAARACAERAGAPCAGCSSVTASVAITWKDDSLGRRLYFLRCSHCQGNHTGKWLPHTTGIAAAATPPTTTDAPTASAFSFDIDEELPF